MGLELGRAWRLANLAWIASPVMAAACGGEASSETPADAAEVVDVAHEPDAL
jgi:hypothetical protein